MTAAAMRRAYADTRFGQLHYATTGDGPVRIVPVGAHEFEVTPRYCLRNDLCGTASRHVRVEVRWGGRTIYALETVYTDLRS